MAPPAPHLKCAICGKPVKARSDNPEYPFCSERCRMIDLGNWLGGGYRIPGPPATAGDVVEALVDARRRPGPTVH